MSKRIPCFLLLAFLASICPASEGQTKQKKPVYALLLDNTGSLRKQFPEVLQIGKALVSRVVQSGPVEVFSFRTARDENYHFQLDRGYAYEGGTHDRALASVAVEWSQDQSSIRPQIDKFSLAKGNTALFDGIHRLAEALDAKLNTEPENFDRKIIILVTDGEDRPEIGYDPKEDHRRRVIRKLIADLKTRKIKVYAVGLVRDLEAYGGIAMGAERASKEKAMTFLEKITKETGGRVVFPKSKRIDPDRLVNELIEK